MIFTNTFVIAAASILLANCVTAQAASGAVTSNVLPTPSVAPGYTVTAVASALETPRGIIFDSTDRLLTIQRGLGVVGLVFSNQTNSTEPPVSTTIISDPDLNHGIELSADGKTLYASSTEAVYSWAYDSMTGMNTSAPTVLVTNMTTADHTTRTLLLSRKAPGMLLVSRGSTSNVDAEAMDISTGHSQIKAFDLTNMTGPLDFNSDGMLLGWGLRNDVGMAEEPTMGGLYSVENSVDQMTRMGVDIHATNPGEELNYLGTMMNNTSPNQGSNFGYPECYAAYDPSVIPQNQGLKVGMQFAIGAATGDVNDTFCQNDRTAPRLVFESHMAPLDIKFDTSGNTAWVTFHGSWNRAPMEPSGYKVSAIPFSNGQPVAANTSTNGYVDIISNADNSQCPDKCFRPVGLAFDSQGRLFFSSDSTGEIYMITHNASNGSNGTSNGTVQGAPIPSATASVPGSTSTAGAGSSIATSTTSAGTYLLYAWLAAVAVAGSLI